MSHSTQLISDTSISIPEQQKRVIEFFREFWGIQDINFTQSHSQVIFTHNKHRYEIVWKDTSIHLYFECQRTVHEKEWKKNISAISTALSIPVPPYYLTTRGKRETLRKQARSTDVIGCFFYPYKEDDRGGWDYDVECLMIFERDFEKLAPGINMLYPRSEDDIKFDFTSWNEFSRQECIKMITYWRNSQPEAEYGEFIEYVATWVESVIENNKTIMIEGNL